MFLHNIHVQQTSVVKNSINLISVKQITKQLRREVSDQVSSPNVSHRPKLYNTVIVR